MKTKKIHTNKMRVAAFAALTLGALSLLTGCASQDENPVSKGTAQLSFRVGGINNSAASTRALPASETVNRVLDDGTILSFTLAPDVPATTRATTPMAANNTYEFVVLDGSNNIVGAVSALAGTNSDVIGVDNTQNYTVVAYSYNNTTAMPSPGTVNSLATTVPAPANVDLLYATPIMLTGSALSTTSVNWQNLTFNHKYSQVKVVVNATQSNANVTAASFKLNVGSYATDLTLATGAVAKQAAAVSAPVNITFQAGSLGGQTATSDSVAFFNNGETSALPLAPFTVTVNSLTIGGVSFPSGTNVPFTKALDPGFSYTLTVRANTQIPQGLTLAENRYYFLSSMIAPAVQGTIPSGGVQVRIPYNNTNATPVTLNAYTSVPVAVPGSMIQGGGAGVPLTLTWGSQPCAPGAGFILATIQPDATLNAKQLLFGDNGTDNLGTSLAQLKYPCKFGDKTATGASSIFTTYFVQEMAGIPDAKYGQYDLGSTTVYEHQFIYLPVQGEDWAGSIWLNNNLGADYANVDKTGVFNPNQQATSSADWHAYGSLFQWGRNSDGHELMNWTGSLSTDVTQKYGSVAGVAGPVSAVTSVDFIHNSLPSYDWLTPQNPNLWLGVSGVSNPCPNGFKVPIEVEQTTLTTAAGITDLTTAASSNLKFSAPGYRSYFGGTFNRASLYGYYWSSTVSSTVARIHYFTSGGSAPNGNERAYGFSVRCIKN